MIIDQDLPYKFCDKCPEFIMNVETLVIYADNNIGTRKLTITCKNERLCKKLAEIRRETSNE